METHLRGPVPFVMSHIIVKRTKEKTTKELALAQKTVKLGPVKIELRKDAGLLLT